MSLGKLNFGAPHWILGGWVVLQKKVCNHNYTTPANERGPAAYWRADRTGSAQLVQSTAVATLELVQFIQLVGELLPAA